MSERPTSWRQRLRAWLRGDARARDVARLEEEARQDAFLEDALRGYDRHPEHDHEASLQRLEDRLNARATRNARSPRWLRFRTPLAAAASLALLVLAAWWLWPADPPERASDPAIAREETPLPQESEPAPPSTPSLSPAAAARATEEAEAAVSDTAPPIAGRSPTTRPRSGAEDAAPAARRSFSMRPAEARPAGGKEAWQAYLQANLQVPEAARDAGIRGEVGLAFTAYENQPPQRIVITDSLGYGCEAEAIRLLREGPPWIVPRPQDSARTTLRIPFPADFSPSTEH